MATNRNNTQTTRVMNSEWQVKRAAILADWRKKAAERVAADELHRAERLAELMNTFGCSEGDARLIMAAEDHPCESISSII